MWITLTAVCIGITLLYVSLRRTARRIDKILDDMEQTLETWKEQAKLRS